MRFRLLPTDDKFFDLFIAASENVVDCTRRLVRAARQPDATRTPATRRWWRASARATR